MQSANRFRGSAIPPTSVAGIMNCDRHPGSEAAACGGFNHFSRLASFILSRGEKQDKHNRGRSIIFLRYYFLFTYRY